MGPDGLMQGRVNVEQAAALRVVVYEAYSLILARMYGAELPAEYPRLPLVTDREDGLDRYFTIDFDSRFTEVKVSGERPALPDGLRARMRSEVIDLDELTRALPPERFTISGFAVIRALDVTEHFSLSGLRRDLIHQESIVSTSGSARSRTPCACSSAAPTSC